MKKQKLNKGITLIALIITIIILLILAMVSVKILIDQGIIGRSKSATEQYTVEDEKERIKLGYNDYKIAVVEAPETAELKVSGAEVTPNGENSWLITFDKTGNQYELKDGNITPIKVTEPIEVGSYVHYNVEYEDMYSGQIFSADNGWRYLGKDDAGNNLIVSTGIPGILNYHYDGTNGTWWDSNTELNPNVRAANGMKNNFESIPFSYQATGTSVSEKNTGIYRKVGDNAKGQLPSTAFRADGVNVIGVHILTLEELNRATNKASGSNRGETSTASGFKDLEGTALGLFDMRKLEEYGESTYYYYWSVSPYLNSAYSMFGVYCIFGNILGSDFDGLGIRPVVVLSPEVSLTVIEQ